MAEERDEEEHEEEPEEDEDEEGRGGIVEDAGATTTRRDFSELQHEPCCLSEEAGYLQSDDFRIAERPAAECRHRPL